jgi:hypothetical protein
MLLYYSVLKMAAFDGSERDFLTALFLLASTLVTVARCLLFDEKAMARPARSFAL